MTDKDKTEILNKHSSLGYGQNKHFCKECGEGFREIANFNKHEKSCGRIVFSEKWREK